MLALCSGVMRGQIMGLPHDTLKEMVVSCVVPHDDVQVYEAACRGVYRAACFQQREWPGVAAVRHGWRRPMSGFSN
ncbi:hypothetical protein [Solimonas sp. SE-A11]|uniref:hypothetical protein n=1 Tax=Solimonas sp. SE-A11 TaxID=3054954 RepID=UPI00259CBD22|nr:hypothetical protein [Solimonas sp. SE-A11]MDM4769967.1 hypothetical protein [Solimonas sp. SE-A11]